MHVWGHEVSSQLLAFWIRGGSRESPWICDAVVTKNLSLVLRTLCKMLQIGGSVSIFSKVLVMSEGQI